MSDDLKCSVLKEFIGADHVIEIDIEKENNVIFTTDDGTFYVLTEKERDEFAWDILYNSHDDEWYRIETMSELLNIDKEKLEIILTADKLLHHDSFVQSDGLMVQGNVFNDLIYRYMSFPEFIDKYFEWHKKQGWVGMVISDGNEIVKDGFYIYQIA